MYTNCIHSGSKLYNNNKTCWAYGFSTPFGQRALHVCGQCLPKAVTTAKLKKREVVFRCSGPLLAIKWCAKRAVTVLTTVHAAVHVEANKLMHRGIEF